MTDIVERDWARDDYLEIIRALNGVIKRQRLSLKELHKSNNLSIKVCAGFAHDMQLLRAEHREAAIKLATLTAKAEGLVKALDDAIREIVSHNSDYHHVTEAPTLIRLRTALAAYRADQPAVKDTSLRPGTYFANLLGHEWIGPDGIRYETTKTEDPKDPPF